MFLPKPSGFDRFGSISLPPYIKYAFPTIVPKTGNIAKVGFRTETVTTSQPLKISLQNLDGKKPDGVILGSGNAYGIQSSLVSNTFYLVTLNAVAAVTKGVPIAPVIEWESTVGTVNIAAWEKFGIQRYEFDNIYDAFTADDISWLTGNALSTVCFEYDDGTYAEGTTWPIKERWLEAIGPGQVPTEVGNYFKLARPYRVKGLWVFVKAYDTYDYDLVLYGEETKTINVNGSARTTYNEYGLHAYLFDSPTDLLADTWYRATLKRSASEGWITGMSIEVPTAVMMDSFQLGQSCYRTERTGTGSWTNITTKRCAIGLWIEDYDAGGGSGGGGGSYLIDGGLVR